MARANCRPRAANKYLGQAVQTGELHSERDGMAVLYRLVTAADD